MQANVSPDFAAFAAADWARLHDGGACTTHALYAALESSGSVNGNSGWESAHLRLDDGDTLAAAVPLYVKHHSYGEYVFDWAWADAYRRHGLDYYPKLVAAVPFTPVPGARFFARDAATREAAIAHTLGLAEASGASSLHILFPSADEVEALRAHGLLIREGVQFHWHNRGYRDFDDFLGHLSQPKRKKIRQERRRAGEHGLRIEWLDGHSASADDWRFFYRCHATTYALRGNAPYLSAAFFTTLAREAPDSVRLVIARAGDTPVAAAFFLRDATALYGRYWGAVADLPFVHFELCYYQAIEHCITHGLQRFEGGAQGEHKLARGLEAVRTWSAHWLRDERFRDAVDRYLERERGAVNLYLDELDDRSPFRNAR